MPFWLSGITSHTTLMASSTIASTSYSSVEIGFDEAVCDCAAPAGVPSKIMRLPPMPSEDTAATAAPALAIRLRISGFPSSCPAIVAVSARFLA